MENDPVATARGSETLLPAKVRVIAFAPNHGPEAVVSALVRGIMARLADDDAIVDGVCSS